MTSDTPLFEVVSNPSVKAADAQAYHRGDISLQELADRSIDTVTGKPITIHQAEMLAAFAVRVARSQENP